MKLSLQITLLAAFIATFASAQMRGHGDDKAASTVTVPTDRELNSKSFAFSSDSGDPDVEGTLGCRQECDDERFTMVCDWEAFKKKSKKSYKSDKSHKKSHKKSSKGKHFRRLGEMMDFEDEENAAMVARETTEVVTEDGRRLKVELDHVECILGVGKKDSYDSDEDYEEYKERLKFPDDFKLTIKEATDFLHDESVDVPDYYKFNAKVNFEDIEDPNDSAEEITISGEVEVELLCVIIDGKEKLIYDDSDIKFSC